MAWTASLMHVGDTRARIGLRLTSSSWREAACG